MRSRRVVLDHVSGETGLLFYRRRACRRGLGRRGWFVPRLHLRERAGPHERRVGSDSEMTRLLTLGELNTDNTLFFISLILST